MTPPARGLEIMPVVGMGEVRPGDDLAEMIITAAPWIADGDVLVVTSKIVSKAEGRLADVPAAGVERESVRESVLAAETARTVAARGPTRIVQTHHGFVLANAGIDASNVDSSRLVLLPKDPDASARGLRTALRERYDRDVAVVVTDTMGRPWRLGLVDVAIGAAGVDALVDYRGAVDPYGNELQLTEMAVIDELAGAAELVKGKCDGVPVAVVRGYGRRRVDDGPGAAALVRGPEQDLFALGTAEARALGRREAALLADATGFGGGRVDLVAVDRLAAAFGCARIQPPDRGGVPAAPTLPTLVAAPPGTAALLRPPVAGDRAWELARVGAAVHRLRCALAAEGLATAWLPPAPGYPLGLLAVGPAAPDPRPPAA